MIAKKKTICVCWSELQREEHELEEREAYKNEVEHRGHNLSIISIYKPSLLYAKHQSYKNEYSPPALKELTVR